MTGCRGRAAQGGEPRRCGEGGEHMQRFSQVSFRPLLRDKPNMPLLCPSVPGQGRDCTRMHQSRHSRPSPVYEQTRPMLYLHPQTGTRPTPASAEERRPAGCAGHRHWILLRIRLSCPTPIPPAKRAAPSAGHTAHSTVRPLTATPPASATP